MSFHHLSREERYQIFALLKEGLTQSQIVANLRRKKSTISLEITRNSGLRGYRPRQYSFLAEDRSLNSHNARQIESSDWLSVKSYLKVQWSPEQIAAEVPISHETIYRHIYADKALGGVLYRQLRCQKKRRKRYAGGRDRRGQIIGRRPISERPGHIEERRQIGHWEGDTVIGKGHKQAIVSLVERKSGYAVLAKVKNKTADLVSNAIIDRLKPLATKVKTLTMTMEKSSHITLLSIKPWDRRPTSPIHIPVGKEVRMKISTALSANTSQKLVRYQRSAMQNLLKSSAFLIIDRANAWDTKHLSKSL